MLHHLSISVALHAASIPPLSCYVVMSLQLHFGNENLPYLSFLPQYQVLIFSDGDIV